MPATKTKAAFSRNTEEGHPEAWHYRRRRHAPPPLPPPRATMQRLDGATRSLGRTRAPARSSLAAWHQL